MSDDASDGEKPRRREEPAGHWSSPLSRSLNAWLAAAMEPSLAEVNRSIAKSLAPLAESYGQWQASVAGQLAPMLKTLEGLNLQTGGEPRVGPADAAYSDEMTSPEDYFGPNEALIDSFDDLHRAIQVLVAKNPQLDLLWRGQADSSWGLHSSLFRTIMAMKGVHPPNRKHRAAEPYPTEDDLVIAETRILETARSHWRLDGTDALEIFARLQHFGAPTRLLDVTRNPYIAAWFAVEASEQTNAKPGRLFALATHPVLSPSLEESAASLTQVRGELANSFMPFWHAFGTPEDRKAFHWGTGAIRRYWVPPLYETRILAQNGAFVIDGVPMSVRGNSSYFKGAGKRKPWRKADLLASSSIYTKLYSPSRKVRENKRQAFPPSFSFKITPKAKAEIREVLETRFSYSHSTIYPDVEGLAQYVRDGLPSMLDGIV